MAIIKRSLEKERINKKMASSPTTDNPELFDKDEMPLGYHGQILKRPKSINFFAFR
jgi:hypothetical protein